MYADFSVNLKNLIKADFWMLVESERANDLDLLLMYFSN